MFNEKLMDLIKNVDGSIGAILIGVDGITVSKYSTEEEYFDIEAVGIEFSVVFNDIKNVVASINGGKSDEIVIKSEKYTIIIKTITEEYFLALVLKPNAITGKGKFWLKILSPDINKEL